jgi:hypothetical protein
VPVDGANGSLKLPPLPTAGAGRRVVLHLGALDERSLHPDWLAIQAGSRRYYQLLDRPWWSAAAPTSVP